MTRRPLPRACVVAALAAIGSAVPAHGDEITNVYELDTGAFNNALNANSLADRVETAIRAAGVGTRPGASPQAPKAGSLAFRATTAIDTPTDFARTYPVDQRASAEGVFRRLLVTMGQLERQYGQPRRDIPTAVALFIGSSHEAATGRPFTSRYAVPLIRQVRGALAADARLTGASNADKERLYEQLAIVGMLTAGTTLALQAEPDSTVAARLKASSAASFRDLLGVAPGRVSFTAKGMTVKR